MAQGRAYTKVARAAMEDRTRSALLDAAAAAFLSRPWDQVSLESIATDAGLTKQTLLRHFGSKDGLLREAWERAYEDVREQRLGTAPGDVPAAVDNLVDHYEEYGARALRIAALPGDDRFADFGRRGRELHYRWVDHAFGPWLAAARGRRRERLRAALIVTCDVHAWSILAHDLALPRDEVRATLVMTVRRIIGEDP